MQLGVSISDLHGRIVYANPADAQLHGYTVEELVGQSVAVFSPPENRRPLTRSDLRTATTWRRDSINRRKDGTTFMARLLSDILRDDEGEPVGVVTTCEDISERDALEKQLRYSRDELDRRVVERTRDLSAAMEQLRGEMEDRERSEERERALEAQLRQSQKLEAVGQLTAGIAHDFNNLLTVILANGELAEAGLEPGQVDARAALHDIVMAARTGATMVSHLLRFSRQADLNIALVELDAVVRQSAELARHLLPETITLQSRPSDKGSLARADASAVQQMLMNLLTNARDAMPHGGTIHINLDTVIREGDQAAAAGIDPGEYTMLSVTDTGTGMDAAVRSRLFEPFFTTKPPGQGTGLGMSIIYGLIRQHLGCVEVDSAPGAGTTVRLYFPAARHSGTYRAVPEPSAAPQRGTERILVVEDDYRLRQTAHRVLTRLGYSVLTAGDGVQALAVLADGAAGIDLVLTDLMMPNMGGRDLFEQARTAGYGVPFLFSSGYATRDLQERSALPPDAAFIRKPWAIEELTASVRAVLDGPAHPS